MYVMPLMMSCIWPPHTGVAVDAVVDAKMRMVEAAHVAMITTKIVAVMATKDAAVIEKAFINVKIKGLSVFLIKN